MSPQRELTARDYRQDKADRMAKALLHSKLTVQQIAELFECNRNTIGSWINRRIDPPPAKLKKWAEYTGVSYEWLEWGPPHSPIPKPSPQVNGS